MRYLYVFRFFLILFINSWITASFAGRPLTIDDVAPVPPGHLEIEAGFSHALPKTGGRDQKWPVLSAAYGIVDDLELGLAIQRLNQDAPRTAPTEGFEDLHLTAKYKFLNERQTVPALAASFDLKVPTASRSKNLSSGKTDETLLLITTKSWSPFTMHGNFGYTIVGDVAGRHLKNLLRGGMAGEWALNSQSSLVGEVSGISRSARGEPNQADFQLGFRYAVQPGLVLDFAGGRSLRSSGTVVQGTLGITWMFDVNALIKR